jgi:hypothetical protein
VLATTLTWLRSLTCLYLAAQVALAPAHVARTDGDYCTAGETLTINAGFGAGPEQLGPIMGTPTSCEYPDPMGSGDVAQRTSVDLPSESTFAADRFSPFVGRWAGHGRVLEGLSTGEALISYRTYRVCGRRRPRATSWSTIRSSTADISAYNSSPCPVAQHRVPS